MVFSFRHLIHKYLQAEEICKLCNLVFTNEVCCEQHKGGRDHKAVAQAWGWSSIISTSITTWVTIRIWLSKIVQIRQHVWFMVFMFLQLNVEFVKNVSIIVAFTLKFTMDVRNLRLYFDRYLYCIGSLAFCLYIKLTGIKLIAQDQFKPKKGHLSGGVWLPLPPLLDQLYPARESS